MDLKQSDIEIRLLSGSDAEMQEWDSYVNAHSQATFFHLSGWKRVLEEAFGHKCHFLFAIAEGKIVGLLPLARIKSLLFGDTLVSLPFCVYGGALTDNEVVADSLTQHALNLAEGLGTDTLELRNQNETHAEWHRKELYVTFIKEIEADNEKNLLAIPKKQRAMVRKGIKAGLTSTETEGVDELFAAYSESVRNLGTPVFPKRYFKILREVFGEQCRVLTIYTAEKELVASVMSFYFRDQVLPYYGGGRANARNCYGNDFMYWELMRRSADEGIKIYDFGRSKIDTGAYRFKKHWGFIPEPLHYEVKLIRAKEIPEINPLNPKYQRFIKIWRRLPLGVANFVGPFLAKDLG